jgi:hypothetical protein
LKNNKAKASKKSKDSEKRCLKDDAIDNCAFTKPLSHMFNRSMAKSVFPDMCKVSYVTPICKKGRRKNVEDYRGVAILFANSKAF